MQMRPSRVLRKLRAGERVMCTKFNLADPRVIDIAGMYDFDCFWIDLEHVPTDWSTMESLIRAGKVYDIDVVVRVARGPYSDYIQPLEADASGIMVPHIMSLSDAQAVVRQTRFHPIGLRPMDGGNVDAGFCMMSVSDYIEQANRERFVIVQIEDPEPLAELEAIAKLDGIDMLFYGPGDFSQAIGVPGQFDDPRIQETRELVAKVARDNGKFAGTVSGPQNIEATYEMGYQFVNSGADVYALATYYRDLQATFAKAAKK